MQIIEQKNQPVVKTDIDRFKDQIFGMYSQLKILHTSLMSVWDKANAEEIIRGTEIDAKAIFEQSYAIQMILKTADPAYEIITPYKWVLEDVEKQFNGNTITVKQKVKVALRVTFKADGSVDSLTEI